MSFTRRLYIRAVKKTYRTYEVWESSAGKPEYIKQDGKMLYDTPSAVEEEVLQDFRELTEAERALVVTKLNEGRALGSVERQWMPDQKKPS